MYEEQFGFSGSPFRLAPDPKFFFGSKSHNKAMAYLHYGLRQAEGFIVVTGEIGAGKSILIGHLLDQLDRSNVLAANLVTPNLAPEDLLAHILSAFRIEASGAGKAAELEAFEDFLFDQMNHGRRCLLIVDEAQNLPARTLEELRVLSNLEYGGTPLFQVFLIGQPDFRETLARADMEQLRQRVIASYHLEPMSRAETEKYITHRLSFVGWNGEPALTNEAFDAIHAATGGLPRKIHKLCNRILLYCAVEKLARADGATVAMVLSDMSVELANGGEAERTAARADLDAVAAFRAVELPKAAPAAPVIVAAPAEPVIVATPSPDADEPPPLKIVASEVKAAAPAMTAAIAPTASVFDRLRAKRRTADVTAPDVAPAEPQTAAGPDDDATRPPKPATLDDVADAIAAARFSRADVDEMQADAEAAPDEAPREDDAQAAAVEADLPPFAEEPEGWRKSVVMSINETRDELKRAHQSVAKLRKQLTELDKRRNKRRNQIRASLERAESLLAEFQNAWR